MSDQPGYIDLQVNGYEGVDFNRDGLTADSLHDVCERLRADGVAGFLPTVITEQTKTMAARLRRIVELREADPLAEAMIPGVHIEGPFLSEEDGYRGAHPLDAVRSADPDVMRQLLDAAGGLARIVTLAPERDAGLRVTRMLADRGIAVAAGHCNPTADQLAAALDAGLALFTHLGNGCPMQLHRHDNIIQRVLHAASRSSLCVSFIADGVHVPYPALSNYLEAVPDDQAIVVTDAMAAAGLGPGVHRLGRWEVEVDEHLAAWAPDRSHLVGSAISMPDAVARLRDRLGYDTTTVDRLTRANPQRLLRSWSGQETS